PLADASATHASSLPLPTGLAPELNQLLQTLSDEAIGLDTLAQQTNQDTSRLLSNLMQLELQGLIVQLPGMQYRRA
ncbi:MAG: DNA processing protein DprA, partial [Cyanobacteria bacterium J06628_6]